MIRTMVAEGLYYPEDGEELIEQIRAVLAQSSQVPGNSSVVLAPYGSYEIVLPYIVPALRAAIPHPEVIVILAPPNSSATPGILLPESEVFATPLGNVEVDQPVTGQLRGAETLFPVDEIAHLRDHSIEIMLPVLHYLFGNTPIVPLLVGPLEPRALQTAAHSLQKALEHRRWMVLVSANLSGFTSPRRAAVRAREILRLLMNDPGPAVLDGMLMVPDPPRSFWPILLGHLLAPAGTRPELLHRGTFETEYEDDTGSVVFASIAYR